MSAQRLLRISDVARRLRISSSALRAWEALGLVSPQRTASRYRMYTESDVRLLQRALFLRRARGLNPAAIVHVLKNRVSSPLPPMLSSLPASASAVCVSNAAYLWFKSPALQKFP